MVTITVGKYENMAINGNTSTNTKDTTLMPVGSKRGGLGGVDHFMKRSIKSIVAAYVARLKRDPDYGYPGAKYNIEIVLVEDLWVNPGAPSTTVTIPVSVS